jgi:hypothetical protein
VSDSFGCVSVHLGANTRIICHTYPDSGPILSVDAGDVGLTVHVRRHKTVDAADVVNAKTLADAVAVYLAECERLYHDTQPDTHSGTGTDAETESRAPAGSVEDAAA